MVNNKEFCETVDRIAVKYANLVEKHIDIASERSLNDVYDEVQLLGNITATLERFNRTNNGN